MLQGCSKLRNIGKNENADGNRKKQEEEPDEDTSLGYLLPPNGRDCLRVKLIIVRRGADHACDVDSAYKIHYADGYGEEEPLDRPPPQKQGRN